MEAMEIDGQDVVLREYVYLLRRNLKFLISIVFSFVLFGLIFSLLQPPMYEAKAVVLPPTGEAGAGVMGSELSIMKEFKVLKGEAVPSQIVIALLNSRSLKEAVVKKFHLDTLYKVESIEDAVKELEKRMNARLKRKTGVIEIYTLSEDPLLAAQMANFIIDVAEKMNEELQIFVDKPLLKVIDKAKPPKEKSKPNLKINLIVAFVLGSLVGLGCVTVKTMRDRRVYTLRQIKEFFDTSGFILFPKTKFNKERIFSEILIQREQFSSLAAEYLSGRKKRLILVVSPRNREGKTLVSIQVSQIFLSLNYKTVLVDLNIENPAIQELLEIEERDGMMNFLKDEVPLEEIIFHQPEKLPFDVITLGREIHFKTLKIEDISKIEQLFERYDIIVVDSSSLLESTFVHSLLKVADEVFLVVMLSKTTEEDLQKSKEILDVIQIKNIRVVLNGFNKKLHYMGT